MHVSWLDPFISQYQIEDPSVCQNVIEQSELSKRWNQSLTVGGVNKYSRDSDSLHFVAEAPPVEHEPILSFMQECVIHYTEAIPEANDTAPFGLGEGYTILRYKPGQAYHAFHSDAGWPELAYRHFTLCLYMNTVKDGETEFRKQGNKVKPVAGRAIIFPAVWGYAHRGLPSPDQRYILNAFYGFLKQ